MQTKNIKQLLFAVLLLQTSTVNGALHMDETAVSVVHHEMSELQNHVMDPHQEFADMGLDDVNQSQESVLQVDPVLNAEINTFFTEMESFERAHPEISTFFKDVLLPQMTVQVMQSPTLMRLFMSIKGRYLNSGTPPSADDISAINAEINSQLTQNPQAKAEFEAVLAKLKSILEGNPEMGIVFGDFIAHMISELKKRPKLWAECQKLTLQNPEILASIQQVVPETKAPGGKSSASKKTCKKASTTDADTKVGTVASTDKKESAWSTWTMVAIGFGLLGAIALVLGFVYYKKKSAENTDL